METSQFEIFKGLKMKSLPLISVVIPVYNREKYIKNCLDIMMSQSYKNLEIIVVNDGSTDGSVDIIQQYSIVKLINLKKNRGQSVARNIGMDNANGKYIHFMDDDDEINTTFYENLVKASEKNNADMACCGIIHQKSKGKTQLFKKEKSYTSLKEKLQVTYVGKWGYSVRYLFKSEFLRKNNLKFEEGRLVEDLPFSFQAVFYANKIITVPNAEYLYVFNPNSSLNTTDKETQKKRRTGRKYAKEFVLNFAKKNGNFKIPGVNTGVLRYIFRKLIVAFSNPKNTL